MIIEAIKEIRPATSEEWDAVWRECDYATYFHSREWAQIWQDYTKGKMTPKPLLVTFSDGKRALLPLSLQKQLKGLARIYLSSPGGTFGGWLSTDQLAANHAAALVDYLTTRLGNLQWRLNPYDELAYGFCIVNSQKDETHVLSLREGFEAIYKRWTKGHRSAARKAQREGVLIKREASLEDWIAYYGIYQDSLRRWGNKASSKYSWELFDAMARRQSPFIKIWLATFQSEIIAGAVCFYAKKHVVYWHGAAIEAYFHLRPVNLLLYEIIKHASENGYSWFDFNPSGAHEGVKAFKKSFGAKALMAPVIRVKSKSMRFIERISHLIK